jgi:hypothetical protein
MAPLEARDTLGAVLIYDVVMSLVLPKYPVNIGQGHQCRVIPAIKDRRYPTNSTMNRAKARVLMKFIAAYIPVARNLNWSPSIPRYPKIVGEYCVIALAPDHCEKRVAMEKGKNRRRFSTGIHVSFARSHIPVLTTDPLSWRILV